MRGPNRRRRFRTGSPLLLASVPALVWFVASNAVGQNAAHPVPHFTDVAPRSSFSYVTRNDYRQRKYFIQPMAGGVAIFDFDNDGWPDIFFTNGAELPSMRRSVPFKYGLLHNRREYQGNG